MSSETKEPKERKGYFYEEEETAFVDYITTEDTAQKEKIFREKLYPPLSKMIESIIRRYGLFVPSEEFEDTFNDCMSYLIMKVNNYDVNKGCKVYSYCGTICKNYLLLRRTQDIKKTNNTFSYDTLFPSAESDGREEDTSALDNYTFQNELIAKVVEEIEQVAQRPNISDSERKIGLSLLAMLRHWEDIFQEFGSRKFNKASVYLFIREMTQLTTKEIREGLKIYKSLYALTKQKFVDEE